MIASYRKGIEWIALNDDCGSKDAFDVNVVSSYISTVLLADLFGKNPLEVAEKIVKYRQKDNRENYKVTDNFQVVRE